MQTYCLYLKNELYTQGHHTTGTVFDILGNRPIQILATVLNLTNLLLVKGHNHTHVRQSLTEGGGWGRVPV